jgi:tetratricopeptide (TPR) repeat protein
VLRDGLDEAVAALRAFALVDRETIADERDGTTDAIRLHRLVRQVAAQRADGDGDRMRRALVAALAAVYPRDAYDNPSSWRRCAQFTFHVLVVCETEMIECSDLLDRAGSYFHGRAAYAEARLSFERALAIRENAFGATPDTAESLNNLALLLKHQGNLAEARSLFERALAIWEKVLGPDHPNTAASLNNLAGMLEDQGDLATARPLFKRALAIFEKARGSAHPDTAISLSNLARLLSVTGDTTEAGALFKRAIAIGEKALGREHPRTQLLCANCARHFLNIGRASEALTLAKDALTTALGPDHPWTRSVARVVADALVALGQSDDAAALRARHGIAP